MELNVLYTINNKYIDIMLVSLTSLVSNNKTYDKIKFHIICSDFILDDYKKLESYINGFDNVDVDFYPLELFDISKFNIPTWRGSQIANARLFYQSIINPSIERLLYLDADTIVVGDLANLEVYDKVIMAVKDNCLKSYLNHLKLENYYNSGVLLFNVREWADNLYEEKIVKFLRENKYLKLIFPDQDILNLCLQDEFSNLDYKYNITPYSMIDDKKLLQFYYNEKRRQIDYSDVVNSIKDPKILHCYGFSSLKPWSNNNINPFNDIFMYYMNLVNPKFNKTELKGINKSFNQYEHLFYLALLLKSFIPPHVEAKIKKYIH